jgi:hypothetical protein
MDIYNSVNYLNGSNPSRGNVEGNDLSLLSFDAAPDQTSCRDPRRPFQAKG